jgi:hypothetical protein
MKNRDMKQNTTTNVQSGLLTLPDAKPVLYDGLLLAGEAFWIHDNGTLDEIRDCLNVFKVANRLPNCFWESISDIHATNYSSIYNLTRRMIERDYPECNTVIKPNRQFLLWMYERMCAVAKENIV